MRLSVRRSFSVLCLAGLGIGLLSCGDSSGPGGGSDIVGVSDFAFTPSAKTVAVGATVQWQWNGGTHNVTWVTSSGSGDSPTQSSGTYSRTFNTAGTYAYYCTLHGTPTSGMRGSIVVQ
jgi:plastocyanin